MRSLLVVFPGLLLVLALPLLGGCSSPDQARGSASVVSERGLVDVDVEFEGPVVRGDNRLWVKLAAQSAPDAAALVAVDASMAAHAHEAHAAAIVAQDGAFEVQGLDLFMTGRWQLELGLAVGKELDHASLPVDVP